MRIDLHTHSAESDGTDTPTQLVDAAIEAGLDVIALTDHDTTAGWQAAAEAVRARSGRLRLVPGAELSCACPNGRGGTVTAHLLAYLFDSGSPTVAAEQSRLRAERRERLRKMAGIMAEAGFPVDPDDVMDRLPADSPGGRPHLARALVRGGAVSSVDEAFDRYLHSAGPYYLPRADTPVHRAIEMITEAGGVTVLAHPFAPRGSRVTAEVIRELAGSGLVGVEVDHPDHGRREREQLRALAAELDLVPTGSSDYHGKNKTLRIGQEQTPPASLERLAELSTGSVILE
ncbi:PHP domain-containing protein [Bounagaea algeriensis]